MALAVGGSEIETRYRATILEAQSGKEVFSLNVLWLALGIPICHTGVKDIFQKVLILWLSVTKQSLVLLQDHSSFLVHSPLMISVYLSGRHQACLFWKYTS